MYHSEFKLGKPQDSFRSFKGMLEGSEVDTVAGRDKKSAVNKCGTLNNFFAVHLQFLFCPFRCCLFCLMQLWVAVWVCWLLFCLAFFCFIALAIAADGKR